jgi:N-acetyl-gamma-glutamylphosphate reductase
MTTRREFTKTISIGSFGTLLLGAASCGPKEKKQPPAIVWPSDKINIAVVGAAGQGAANIRRLKDQNIVALCDVDWGERTQKTFESFPNAKRYKDFREMLEKQKDIDAVVIATPDHNHGVIAMMAIKMGKHVFVKNLWHTRYMKHAKSQRQQRNMAYKPKWATRGIQIMKFVSFMSTLKQELLEQ